MDSACVLLSSLNIAATLLCQIIPEGISMIIKR